MGEGLSLNRSFALYFRPQYFRPRLEHTALNLNFRRPPIPLQENRDSLQNKKWRGKIRRRTPEGRGDRRLPAASVRLLARALCLYTKASQSAQIKTRRVLRFSSLHDNGLLVSVSTAPRAHEKQPTRYNGSHRRPVVLIPRIHVRAAPNEESGHGNHALPGRRVQRGPGTFAESCMRSGVGGDYVRACVDCSCIHTCKYRWNARGGIYHIVVLVARLMEVTHSTQVARS